MVGAAESNARIEVIAEKVGAGERLTPDEGVELFDRATLLDLSAMADCVRQRLHPEPVVTYVIGRTINYTNYYEDLLAVIKARFPVHLHALSTVEISYISSSSKISLMDTLKRLKAAGFDCCPGGGVVG